MQKRILRLAAYVSAVAFVTALTGLAGCGKKDEAPTNDPNYYKGADYKKGAAKTKGAGE